MEKRIACIFLLKRASTQALAEACYRFTPKLAVREEEAVFLDLRGTEGLYSELGLRARIYALAKRLGVEVEVALASSAGEALALARHAGSSGRAELPLEAFSDFLSPFRENRDSAKRVRAIIETLSQFGVSRIGEFLRLPSASLASRFGREASELYALVRGELERAWPGFKPSQRLLERADLEECTDLGAMAFVLRGMVDRAMARLRGQGRRASAVRVELVLERWSVLRKPLRAVEVILPLPQGSALGLIPILQEQLAHEFSRRPLEAPVREIRFEVLETVPGNGAQKEFFSRKEEDSEAWNALVARLAHRVGKDRVFQAAPVDRHLPEAAWERVLEVGLVVGVNPDVPARPVRILRKPEPLYREGEALMHLSGKCWEVQSWEGHERLSGEWWRDPEQVGFNRDYFRVVTKGGEQLWVFQNRKAKGGGLYLQGYFD